MVSFRRQRYRIALVPLLPLIGKYLEYKPLWLSSWGNTHIAPFFPFFLYHSKPPFWLSTDGPTLQTQREEQQASHTSSMAVCAAIDIETLVSTVLADKIHFFFQHVSYLYFFFFTVFDSTFSTFTDSETWTPIKALHSLWKQSRFNLLWNRSGRKTRATRACRVLLVKAATSHISLSPTS